MNETIDILLATYNSEKYLEEQLDSILNQTYQNIKVIISDDNSSDNTIKIIKEYQTKDSRIVLHEQNNNLGYKKNFEFLLNQVESNCFMLADHDDVWNKDKVELSYNKIIETSSELVYTDLLVVDKDLNLINNSFIKQLNVYDKCLKFDDYKLLFLDNVVTGCTIIAKKEIIESSLPIPEKIFVHDWWMALMASQRGKVAFLNEPTMKYRQHGNNAIGAVSAENKHHDFKKYREEIICFKIEQFKIYNREINKFNKSLHDLIINGLEYYEYISKINKIGLKKITIFHKLYKNEKVFRRFKLLFLFHIPIIGKKLWNIREK